MSDELRPRTRLVHAGTRRSQYGETSEAIFLTQGFVYPDAETAEARFISSGPDEFVYARYGNPTTRMFEDRIASLEGAEDAFATASGMGAAGHTVEVSAAAAATARAVAPGMIHFIGRLRLLGAVRRPRVRGRRRSGASMANIAGQPALRW